MLRYIKDSMATIDGIEIYPIMSLVIFFTFFVGMVYFVMKKKKGHYDEISNLPLKED